MVLIEKYIREKMPCGITKWKSLVRCEDCKQKRTAWWINISQGRGVVFCKKCYNKGARNANYHVPCSEERRLFLSRINTGKWVGPNNPFYGKHHTEATRKIMREKHQRLSGPQHHNFGTRNSPHTRMLISIGLKGKYRGEKSGRWNASLTTEERIQCRKVDAAQLNDWRMEVFRRDKFTCQITGDDMGGNLNAHHLYNWRQHIIRRHDIHNGITIRKDIHRLFHQIYGIKNNTPAQFLEFAEYMHDVLRM